MFREMRRGRQALGQAECEDILRRGSYGVLALLGDGGYPYAVPLNYVYESGRIYFHCAKAGHKLDALRNTDKASFCVVEQSDVVPEKFATRYRSAIAFGRVREMTDEGEMRRAIGLLLDRLCPDVPDEAREAETALEWAGLNMLEFTVEHMSGKVNREGV